MKNKHNFFSFGGHKLLQKYTKMPPKSVKNCLKSSQNCPKSTTNGKCAKMTKLKLILRTYGRPISQGAYAWRSSKYGWFNQLQGECDIPPSLNSSKTLRTYIRAYPTTPPVCDGTQNFQRYRYRYFFPVPNISDTDTGTFSGTKFFRYRFRDWHISTCGASPPAVHHHLRCIIMLWFWEYFMYWHQCSNLYILA